MLKKHNGLNSVNNIEFKRQMQAIKFQLQIHLSQVFKDILSIILNYFKTFSGLNGNSKPTQIYNYLFNSIIPIASNFYKIFFDHLYPTLISIL